MTWFARLYPLLTICVLATAGCGGEESGNGAVASVPRATPTEASTPRSEAAPATVMFFGDSITAGYGIGTEDAFPALIQARADSAGLPIRVVNAGLSGETSAAGLRRIGWVLREPVDVFVLELGGNDALRGTDLAATRRNLQAIVDSVRSRNPATRIVIAGMMIPPNFGAAYAGAFRDIFPELASANDAVLVPFLLDGVARVDGMMQADGIHPTRAGHRVMAETTWRYLEPELRELLHAASP
jgi:acyl-CoA thioesterase-1